MYDFSILFINSVYIVCPLYTYMCIVKVKVKVKVKTFYLSISNVHCAHKHNHNIHTFITIKSLHNNWKHSGALEGDPGKRQCLN